MPVTRSRVTESPDMFEELNRASHELRIALDKYLAICTFIRDSCLGNTLLNNNLSFHNSIESEWNQFMSHKSKLEAAQAAINASRNMRTITGINSLPLELLTCIFSLVVRGQPCLIYDDYHHIYFRDRQNPIQYPDALSHVCSLWRRVAIAAPHLWSHIDIALNHPRNHGLFARAEAFATRAGATPLGIHVFDPGFRRNRAIERLLASSADSNEESLDTPEGLEHDPSTMHDFQFLPSPPARIETLDILFGPEEKLRACHLAALEYFLAQCTPGVLNRFSMRLLVNTFRYSYFIESADNPHYTGSSLLAIPARHLEEIWLQVTTLRINGPCPPWSSKAYHGLVELRIGEKSLEILESQLIGVLRSSPRLRVLHLRTIVEEQTPLDDPVVPIRLEDLEELDIKDGSPDEEETFGTFLRWIAPGPRPLQLSFYGYPFGAGPTQFCTRSNITRFFGQGFHGEPLVDMIRRSPWLEVLGLNADGCEGLGLYSILHEIDPDEPNDGLAPMTQVHTLYLREFNRLPFADIRNAVKNYSVRHLILRNTSIKYRTNEGRKIVTSDPRQITAILSTLQPLPTIECLTDRCPLDLEHWWP